MLASGVFLLMLGVVGIFGSLRQTKRAKKDGVGRCGGRQLMTLYQVMMITLVLGQSAFVVWLRRVQDSLEVVGEQGGPYNRVEIAYKQHLDDAFFQLSHGVGGSCTDGNWATRLAAEVCPQGIPSHAQCACASFQPFFCRDEATYNVQACCPNEQLCMSGSVLACPYDRCRSEFIKHLLEYVRPAVAYIHVVLAAEVAGLILTCLLCCYNPRDSVREMLLKTGALRVSERGADLNGIIRIHKPGTACNEREDVDEEEWEGNGTDMQDVGPLRKRPAALLSTTLTSEANPYDGPATPPPSAPLQQYLTPRAQGRATPPGSPSQI
ncbi:unnamed protein product [Chrysoparadoxa australica]